MRPSAERRQAREKLRFMFLDALQILLSGMCVGLASSVTVGPVAVLCIQRTLSKGRMSGMMSGLGIACADTLMAILSFTVYALLKSQIDRYDTTIQICGGIFVIIVGFFIFFKNPVPQIRKNRAGKTNLWQDFGSMFGFTLANFVVVIPYILAFFTMFNIDLSPQSSSIRIEAAEKISTGENIVQTESSPRDESYRELQGEAVLPTETVATDANIVISDGHTLPRITRDVMVITGFLCGAVLWWFFLTFVINMFRRGFRPRHMLTINHVAGIIIGILGFYTLISVLIKH